MLGWKQLEIWKRSRLSRRALLLIVGYCLVISTTWFGLSLQTNASQKQANPPGQVVRINRSKQTHCFSSFRKTRDFGKSTSTTGF